MREPIRREVDGTTYEFYHFSVRKQNRLLMKLTKLVIKPLVSGLDSSMLEKGSKETKADLVKKINISNIVDALTESLDEDKVDEIIDELMIHIVCIGKGSAKDNFSEIFDGKLLHMWRVVIAAIDCYFGDFLKEGLGLLKS